MKVGKWTSRCFVVVQNNRMNFYWATPFSLAFRVEAVISIETSIPTALYQFSSEEKNNEMLNFERDIIDKKHEVAVARIASYKQQAAKYYNKNVRTRTFQTGTGYLGNFSKIQKKVVQENWEQTGKDHIKSLK